MKQLILIVAAIAALTLNTSAQSVRKLAAATAAEYGANYEVEIEYTDLIAAGASSSNLNLTIFPLGTQFRSNQVVKSLMTRVDVPFQSSGDTNLNGFVTMSVGDVGSTTRFMGAIAVASNNAVDVWLTNNLSYRYSTPSNIIARFSASGAAGANGGTLSNLTGGRLRIYLETVNPNDLP